MISKAKTPTVLFVCLGNICRSPSAQAVFKKRAKTAGLKVIVESAGTGGWHAGDPPDPRAKSAGERRGYSFKGQLARKVTANDFAEFDYILAMDRANFRDLKSMSAPGDHRKIQLFLDFGPPPCAKDVPDPYYGGEAGFEQVLDLIEDASDGLIRHLQDG